MIDVGRWQHTEFIQEMNVASIRTNLSATILSWFSDTALKEIKYIKYLLLKSKKFGATTLSYFI